MAGKANKFFIIVDISMMQQKENETFDLPSAYKPKRIYTNQVEAENELIRLSNRDPGGVFILMGTEKKYEKINYHILDETPFSQRLRAIRRERHLSQDKLGKIIGVHRSYISALETRPKIKPSKNIISVLAYVLDVPRSFLVGPNVELNI